MTVLTLIFTPMLRRHHWVTVLTGKTTKTYVEQCSTVAPAHKRITKRIVRPRPQP